MTVPAAMMGDQDAEPGADDAEVKDQSTTDDEGDKGAGDGAAADDAADDQGDGSGDGDDKGGDEGKPEAKTYKLPDGREMTADELYKEHTENLLPEFTRKSQRLTELEQGSDPNKINKDQEKKPDRPWKDPDWVPKDSREIIEAAKESLFEDIQSKADAEKQLREEASKVVDGQLAEIRKIDPKLDENTLFIHANKYGFTDLKKAHENLQEIKGVAQKTEQRVVKDMKTREADPVGGVSGGNSDDGIDFEQIRAAGGVFGAVQDYLDRSSKKA